jgi:pimeloyl-ACP methyl ester carboxylesterase
MGVMQPSPVKEARNMENSVEVDGVQVFFRVDGSGPNLLLLHGTGGNSETNWSELVSRLSMSHTVIRPDYSGSGQTVDDGRPLSVAMLAAQVVAAAHCAGATTFDLVGFSLGASVAIYLAAEYPHLVRSLVSLSGFTTSNDPRQRLQFELWRDLIRTDRQAMARLLLLSGFSPDFMAKTDNDFVSQTLKQLVATNNWEGMARQVELDLSIDVEDQARRIEKPALIIGCTHDVMVPPAHSRRLASVIPNARYVEINTGHLSTLERPDEVSETLLDFITGMRVSA